MAMAMVNRRICLLLLVGDNHLESNTNILVKEEEEEEEGGLLLGENCNSGPCNQHYYNEHGCQRQQGGLCSWYPAYLSWILHQLCGVSIVATIVHLSDQIVPRMMIPHGKEKTTSMETVSGQRAAFFGELLELVVIKK